MATYSPLVAAVLLQQRNTSASLKRARSEPGGWLVGEDMQCLPIV